MVKAGVQVRAQITLQPGEWCWWCETRHFCTSCQKAEFSIRGWIKHSFDDLLVGTPTNRVLETPGRRNVFRPRGYRYENEKVQPHSYSDWKRNIIFAPLCFSTTGGMGPEAMVFVKKNLLDPKVLPLTVTYFRIHLQKSGLSRAWLYSDCRFFNRHSAQGLKLQCMGQPPMAFMTLY